MHEQSPIGELQGLCPGATEMTEGGVRYVHLPALVVPGLPEKVDALICVQQHGGYSTRLFLQRPVPNKGANWSVHQILGKTWHTWSWNNVPAGLRPAEILIGHLRAFR